MCVRDMALRSGHERLSDGQVSPTLHEQGGGEKCRGVQITVSFSNHTQTDDSDSQILAPNVDSSVISFFH